jgi:hypothetical protein
MVHSNDMKKTKFFACYYKILVTLSKICQITENIMIICNFSFYLAHVIIPWKKNGVILSCFFIRLVLNFILLFLTCFQNLIFLLFI